MTTVQRSGAPAQAAMGSQVPAAQPAPFDPAAETPRRVSGRPADEWLAFAGSLAGSYGLVWIVYDRLLGLSGAVGHMLCWYAVFLALLWTISSMTQPRPIVIDRIATAVIAGGAVIVFFSVMTTIFYTLFKGWAAYTHVNFYTHDMASVDGTAPLNKGGIWHAIVGTLEEIGLAVLVSLPLGVGTAVFITEVGGRFARMVRTVVEAMTALPDILAGLFVYTVLIVSLHGHKSGIAAATALSVMMMPIIARSSEVQLRVVPGGLREASLALGATRLRTVLLVVLPTARSGLATALILGIARGIGETAPVLLTSGASIFLTYNPSLVMNSLPLFILKYFESGQSYFPRMWGAASVLLALVLLLFVAARLLARPRPGR